MKASVSQGSNSFIVGLCCRWPEPHYPGMVLDFTSLLSPQLTR